MSNPKLIFYGGVGTATGANIMLEFELAEGQPPKRLLVDCGLLQGPHEAEFKNFEPFAYDPKTVDFLLITHGHMDHLGRVPKLVREGFNGRIISTLETRDLALPMLQDALNVMKMKHPDKLLFEKEDIDNALSMWQGAAYENIIHLFPNCFITMTNAGHILGSCIFNLSYETGEGVKVISFTGDLGNSPSPLLPDTELMLKTDYVVMESVYGDRNHESRDERRNKLKQALIEGINKNGAIVMPAFSIERTQVLLYEINNMIEGNEIKQVPVFLDSPLAQKVTAIYKKYTKDFKKEVQQEIQQGDDIFNFPGLKIIGSAEESRDIEKTSGAKIILSGSGMSEGGRVVNHEIKYLPDPSATVILVGYQSLGTLGRALQEGRKEVYAHVDPKSGKKELVNVKATIINIDGYSSHKDSDHLIEFIEKSNASHKIKKVFCIMGEPRSSLFLCQRLRDYVGVESIYPEPQKPYELN